MKIKFSPQVKKAAKVFFFSSIEFAKSAVPVVLIISLFLVLPIVGFIYFGFWGSVVGLILSILLTVMISRTIKAIRARKGKALLFLLGEEINIYAWTATIAGVFLFWSSYEWIKTKYPHTDTWLLILGCYYCLVVPIGVFLGIIRSFIVDFSESLKDYDFSIRNNGGNNLDDQIDWESSKFRLKYFNPILLPFSLVGYVIFFIFLLLKLLGEVLWAFILSCIKRGREKSKTVS